MKFNVVASADQVRPLNERQKNQAIGLLLQLYGCLISAGVCTDYQHAISDTTFGFTLGYRNPNKPHGWMGFDYNEANATWEFRYRSFTSKPQKNLWELAQQAHREIARLEKRDLLPLMATYNPARRVGIGLVAG